MVSSQAKNDKIAVDGELAAVPSNINISSQNMEIDEAYLRSSRFTKIFRGVLFQMILFGAISFVGPAMSDAISNLGGGGLSSPYLANLANALNYAAGCVVTLFGGPLINKIGIKWSCMIAAITMPLDGSSYYVSARYGVQWYLLFAKILGGFTSGFLYVAETTAMLSYPHQNDRGLYLGIWSAMRNSGSVIGGAINFATNYSASTTGGVSWATYLIFVGLECTGFIWALFLTPTNGVRRSDGTRIHSAGNMSWKAELQALWKHMQSKKIWLVFIPAFYSFFYGGTMGTYLSLHFSVRARALSTLILPSITIPVVIAYGKLMDMKRWPQPVRAKVGFALWVVPQVACFIWIGMEYKTFGTERYALDYILEKRRWAEAYVPYLIIFVTGYWTQLCLYWILGTFSTDSGSSSRTGGLFRAFETAGQAVSYAINSVDGADPRTPFYVNCAVLGLAIPCMIYLIKLVPEAPAVTDFTAGEVIDGVSIKKITQQNQGSSA